MPNIPGLTRLRWNSDADQVDVQYKQMDKAPSSILQGIKGWIILILALVVTFVVGLILGYLIRRSIHPEPDTDPASLHPSHEKVNIFMLHLSFFLDFLDT